MALDPSARAIGTERGCVEDQPQRVGGSKASGACSVLRLVEDDTAALRSWSPYWGSPALSQFNFMMS